MTSSVPGKVEIERYELTEVYRTPNAQPTVDIVLVHGLNGDPEATWTAKNGIFWPTELLPFALRGAPARVLVYGYNADVYAFGKDKSASSDMIHQHAQTLVSSLANERISEGMESTPIVWVAHSLGGILVKRALEYSNDLNAKGSDPSRSIYISTYGIIFLGTPHTGSDHAKMGLILQAMCNAIMPKMVVETQPHLVRTLKSNNETLQNINLHFLDIYQRFEIDFVHENHTTELVKGVKDFIVDQASASPQLPGVRYYGIEATHSGMCKFESRKAPGFLNVSTTLRQWVNEAQPVIASRFNVERQARLKAKQDQARELMGIFGNELAQPSMKSPQGSSTALTPELSNSGIISKSIVSIEPDKSETYFIKPHGFRPNSLFVGRQAELEQMHRLLFDKKRRTEGTSAILLQSLPGGGKTHLAREYVYRHLESFPGGIFWVRAKSQEQLAAGFWEIARKVALKPGSEHLDESAKKDPAEFVSVVVEWLNSNSQWLLVLDGIHFEHTNEIQRFIPDRADTSMIYTSTERNVGGDHHFDNPQVIRLPPLSAREAQELFLLEMDKKHPSQDELKHSMDLVQRMDFLPLVIHAVATRLRATDEPLARFARAFATGPKLRDLDSYKAVVEQLAGAGAVEALNLMNIMCFLSQHIPVEMLNLGLRKESEPSLSDSVLEGGRTESHNMDNHSEYAVDVQVKAYESASGRSLNNTFKILNRFALIDRSERQDLSSSQSTKSSKNSAPDDVDIIRIHSVVQDFFVDSLKAKGSLPVWLNRAIALFSRSYNFADKRIRDRNKGLVGDYRSYEIHGTRLLKHVLRHQRRFPILQKSLPVLEGYLENIKGEIDRRTRESSEDIVHGQDVIHISIFDRTSSSSDFDPETPGSFDKGGLLWGNEGKSQHSSPISIRGELPYPKPHYPVTGDSVKALFPTSSVEDHGYDSDREARPMTGNTSQEEGWTLVRPRLHHPQRFDVHRTVENVRRTRYHDRAGAWRAVNGKTSSDPRITREIIPGVIQRTSSTRTHPKSSPESQHSHDAIKGVFERIVSPMTESPSRGRAPLSGESRAIVALSQISSNSPPPARGAAGIHDRRRSSLRRPPSRLSEGLLATDQYGSPAPNEVMYTDISPIRTQATTNNRPRPQHRPSTPALVSLQGFSVASGSPTSPISSMPSSQPSQQQQQQQQQQQLHRQPYPSSESLLYSYPYKPSQSETQLMHSSYSSSPIAYPQRTEPLPFSYTAQAADHKPIILQDYAGYGSQSQPTPTTSIPLAQSLPASIPDLSRARSPYPYSAARQPAVGKSRGYTSQPMSRDTSTQSVYSPFNPMFPSAPIESSSTRDIFEDVTRHNNERVQSLSPGFRNAALVERAEDWKNVFGSPMTVVGSGSGSGSGSGGADMERSGSGGLKIGGRIIAFGDHPEEVDVGRARERVKAQRKIIHQPPKRG